jgi:hypothetical protein
MSKIKHIFTTPKQKTGHLYIHWKRKKERITKLFKETLIKGSIKIWNRIQNKIKPYSQIGEYEKSLHVLN